jgi:hypothetical protein
MEWQPIDTAPFDTAILIYGYGSNGYYVDNVMRCDSGFYSFDPYADDYIVQSCDPQGWMPLPAPPK